MVQSVRLLVVTVVALVVTVIIVWHCPCFNIIYTHTDSSAVSVEGQTGTVNLWWIWLLVVLAAPLVTALIIGLVFKKKKR